MSQLPTKQAKAKKGAKKGAATELNKSQVTKGSKASKAPPSRTPSVERQSVRKSIEDDPETGVHQ